MQFFLDKALDVVAMRVDVLIPVFYVVLINTNLRVNLPKTSLHYYYSITLPYHKSPHTIILPFPHINHSGDLPQILITIINI